MSRFVNSLSVPPTDWDQREAAPGAVNVLMKSADVPIDHYSYEAVELLRDTAARWRTMRTLRRAANPAAIADPLAASSLRVPPAEIYAIDVSFPRMKHKAEFDYLNSLPTSFVLPDEAVDRLRASAGTIIQSSPEFQRLLKDIRARVIDAPPAAAAPQ